jgi:hypothetical protein
VKRDPALISLSHDHHQALFVAQGLRRATPETADRARSAFAAFWAEHGSAHFRIEEEILFPAYAAHGDAHHPLLARALCEHVEIRQRAQAAAEAPVEDLNALGTLLAAHVRLEERELFPVIESAIPPDARAALGAALERAHGA